MIELSGELLKINWSDRVLPDSEEFQEIIFKNTF